MKIAGSQKPLLLTYAPLNRVKELNDFLDAFPDRWLHDRVQQAAYPLIPEAEKAAVHHLISWGSGIVRVLPVNRAGPRRML